jgi:hypothetical protein
MIYRIRSFVLAGLVLVAWGGPAGAQVQPFLAGHNPFVWDGVSAYGLVGAEQSTLGLSAASIVHGLYGEMRWDVDGLLGSGTNLDGSAPSFRLKFIPLRTQGDAAFGSLFTVSAGTRALSGFDLYAGWGTYMADGRFALGGGLDIAWEETTGGGLSKPRYEWLMRSYAALTPQLALDTTAAFKRGQDRLALDAALVYQLFDPRFRIYLALLDVFSDAPDRRIGLSYALGL